MEVDKAKVSDADTMHRLINHFADKGDVLPRALSDIYEDIKDFFVVRNEEKVVACAALHVMWLDLAEIRSVVVEEGS